MPRNNFGKAGFSFEHTISFFGHYNNGVDVGIGTCVSLYDRSVEHDCNYAFLSAKILFQFFDTVKMMLIHIFPRKKYSIFFLY